MSYEGVDVAQTLNQMGVDAFCIDSTALPTSTLMRACRRSREGTGHNGAASRPECA